MKRTKMILLFIVCLFSFSSLASNKQSKEKLTGHILWKISGNNLAVPSYILGTNHAIDSQFLNTIPGLSYALANTDQVVGEFDADELINKGYLLQMAGMIPDSIGYAQLLTKDQIIFWINS